MTTGLLRDEKSREAPLPYSESASFHASMATRGADADVDLPAHVETYEHFLAMAQVVAASIVCHLLLLVLWGIEGHGFVALIGFLLTIAATGAGLVTPLGWRAVAPVFALLALTCLVL